jgi:hypothetical protein
VALISDEELAAWVARGQATVLTLAPPTDEQLAQRKLDAQAWVDAHGLLPPEEVQQWIARGQAYVDAHGA